MAPFSFCRDEIEIGKRYPFLTYYIWFLSRIGSILGQLSDTWFPHYLIMLIVFLCYASGSFVYGYLVPFVITVQNFLNSLW